MNYVKIKNYQIKRKEANIPKSNTLLDFNDETSNLKERSLKSLRTKVEEHHSKTLIVESLGLKLINIIIIIIFKITFIIFLIGSYNTKFLAPPLTDAGQNIDYFVG
jgi:hypothetical protein